MELHGPSLALGLGLAAPACAALLLLRAWRLRRRHETRGSRIVLAAALLWFFIGIASIAAAFLAPWDAEPPAWIPVALAAAAPALILASGLFLFGSSADRAKRARREAALQKLALSDPLTGLGNRAGLMASMEAEAKRAGRYGHPVSLVFFDLDHFKRVNDSWGHAAGDAVLKRAAALAGSLIRESDRLFRWGGEEFAVLAPDTSLAGASILAEKMRASMAAADFPDVGRQTASFGVAEWRTGETLGSWFERADSALYRAKNSGRNRVVAAEGAAALPAASLRLEWRAEWSSGDPAIDAEHRLIISMARDLINASLSLAPPGELSAGLAELLGETRRHFVHEEAILRDLGYPGLDKHAALHAELLGQAEALGRDQASVHGGPAIYFDFLVDRVVLGHMLKEDSLFFEYTRARKV